MKGQRHNDGKWKNRERRWWRRWQQNKVGARGGCQCDNSDPQFKQLITAVMTIINDNPDSAPVGIVVGNPRVTQPGPHPYPHLPVPATRMGLPVETSPKAVEKWLRYEQNNVLWRFYSYLSHFSTVSAVFGLILNVAGWRIHTHTHTRAYPRAWPVQVW